MKRFLVWLLCWLGMAVAVPTGEAATYYFNTSNLFGDWAGTIPPGFGYVDVTKGTNDWLFFEVGANTDNFNGTDPGLTWDKFYFNVEDSDLDTQTIVVDEGGNWKVVEDKNVSEFGRFDFGVEGTALGNAANDPLRFRIEDSSFNVEDLAVANADDWLFAAHLRRFDGIDGEDSTFLAVGGAQPTPTTPVPEPGTLLLIGAGLAGLALRRKRTS